MESDRVNRIGSHHNIDDLIPEITLIATEYPRIQDARPKLAAVAIREKAPLVALVEYYTRHTPTQHFICRTCKEEVADYEMGGADCLDCIGKAYEAAAQ